jgi:hypothetical protein
MKLILKLAQLSQAICTVFYIEIVSKILDSDIFLTKLLHIFDIANI